MSAHWRASRFSGHLGTAASALVDGQLDEESADRAWDHVMVCPECRRLVEREGWIKRQVSSIAATPREDAPSDRLMGSLLDLGPVADAWAQVDEIERRGRNRRRAGLALVGAGSVSAAVFGLSTLGGASLGLGSGAPPASINHGASSTRPTPAVVAPAASVHGRLRGWTLGSDEDGVARAHAMNRHR
ncbi:MAG: hypothetical protein HOQ22_06155 [Nocardioidaceae bacterium]|nr:hypothetical protein [Nocardioidaceae bacterium]NUS50612.1 hypothetical protein [Nocardioidaceae bacterium]